LVAPGTRSTLSPFPKRIYCGFGNKIENCSDGRQSVTAPDSHTLFVRPAGGNAKVIVISVIGNLTETAIEPYVFVKGTIEDAVWEENSDKAKNS